MAVAPWRNMLVRSLREHLTPKSQPVLGSLASVTKEGKPKVRAVVFRGFLGKTDVEMFPISGFTSDLMVIGTHIRTRKVEEIVGNHNVEYQM
ncbi:hypothetical protein AX774_g495 [Zancudomyces culisetae]|uniref:Pyridoxamine 5'-phosphate oxidase Alr4036 family FMN-binding domain-containing protein n=1 Tax=Zancudomyces culisetae TaxID=1213189 RepID=A0A1R1PYB3_ZANCU|nr:hypothetical protein AX774_g495 [Zancudomyces culisetae]|eukprot:OMH85953.1 hypothetical protein AX774_g495 [Zancudomyces culisetae]